MATDREQKKLKKVLLKVTAKQAEDPVPRSGPAVKDVDSYAAHWRKDDEPYLLFKKIENDMVTGTLWEGNEFKTETTIPLSELVDVDIHIRHFYGENIIDFEGVGGFLSKRVLLKTYGKIHFKRVREAIKQFFYNRRSLQSQERSDILRVLISRKISDAGKTVLGGDEGRMSLWEVLVELYGTGYIKHPDHKERLRETELLLDSLVESGEANKLDTFTYAATPKAVVTIDQVDREEREYRDSSRMQNRVVALTFVLAIAAVTQAFIGVLGFYFNC